MNPRVLAIECALLFACHAPSRDVYGHEPALSEAPPAPRTTPSTDPTIAAPPADVAVPPTGPRVESGWEAHSLAELLYPEPQGDLAWRVKSSFELTLRAGTLRVVLFEQPGNGAGLVVAREKASLFEVLGGDTVLFGGHGVDLDTSTWVAADGTWATLLVRSTGHMSGAGNFAPRPGGSTYTNWKAYAVRIDAMVDATPPALHLEECEVRLVPSGTSVDLEVRRGSRVERLGFDARRHEFAKLP